MGVEASLKDVLEGNSERVRVVYDVAKAKRILSLDADVISGECHALANARGFAKGRKVEKGDMNRLYVVESRLTLTGANADHRLRLATKDMELFATALLSELYRQKGKVLSQGMGMREGLLALEKGGVLEAHAKWIRELVSDLVKSGSASVVMGGKHLSERTQCLVHSVMFCWKAKCVATLR